MIVYGMGMVKEDLQIVNGIIKAIKKRLDEPIDFEIIDLMSTNDIEVEYPCIIFGKNVLMQLDASEKRNDIWIFPALSSLKPKEENKERRKEGSQLVLEIAEYLNHGEKEISETTLSEKQEAYVEKEEIKFGKIKDICITEEEAEYLNKIKNLLNGSKIVIKKGEITIEVS
jgi:hypothetical protein